MQLHNSSFLTNLDTFTSLLSLRDVRCLILHFQRSVRSTPALSDILPLVKQLLTKATYVDLACNFLPNIYLEPSELKDILQQKVSFMHQTCTLAALPGCGTGLPKHMAGVQVCLFVAPCSFASLVDIFRIAWESHFGAIQAGLSATQQHSTVVHRLVTVNGCREEEETY